MNNNMLLYLYIVCIWFRFNNSINMFYLLYNYLYNLYNILINNEIYVYSINNICNILINNNLIFNIFNVLSVFIIIVIYTLLISFTPCIMCEQIFGKHVNCSSYVLYSIQLIIININSMIYMKEVLFGRDGMASSLEVYLIDRTGYT